MNPPGAQQFDGLLFFGPCLELIGSKVVSETRHTGEADAAAAQESYDEDDQRRRCAEILLGDATVPLTRTGAAVALFRAPLRLRRAQELLREAERHERAARWSAARELWQHIDAEWNWLSASAHVRALLVNSVRSGGSTVPEAVVDAVRAAVPSELLPVLHLKWYLLSAGNAKARACRRAHETFLDGWRAPQGASDGLVRLYTMWLNERTAEPAARIDREGRNVLALLREGHATAASARELMRAYARRVDSWLRGWLPQKHDAAEVQRVCDLFERIAAAGPPSLGLLETIATLYVLKADGALSTQHTDEAIRHLGVACTYDPFDRAARDRLKRLEEQVTGLRAGLEKADATMRERLTAFTDQLQARLQQAQGFGNTTDGAELRRRRGRALWIELACRLGLDPDAETTGAVLDRLFACLEAAQPAANDSTAFPARVREAAMAEGGAVAQLDWDAICAALAKAPVADAEILTLLLPPAQTPLVEPGLASVRDAAATLPHTPPSAGLRGRPLAAATWMFSGRDMPVKILLVAGLLLVLHGGAIAGGQRVNEWISTHAYSRVLGGVRAGDDAGTIAAANEYLRHAGSVADNARARQVLGFLREAVLRETLRLAESGKENEAAQLLERYTDAAQRYAPGEPAASASEPS